MRSFVIVTVLSILALPAGARAHEEEGTWDAPPPPPADDPGVDVSLGISAPGAAVTVDTFQEPLASQGDWVSVNTYGRVWRPRVAEGWRPYYYGRWEWTSEGWLWVSDEPFGWATYHYGRWTQDPYYGWVWIPGTQWAPAWVTWRYSPEYIGWAPLGPGFSVYVTSYPAVYPWWTFVPCGSFVGFPVQRHAYAPAHVPRIWRDTRPAPPRARAFGHAAPAWGGPARGFVETRIGRPVNPVRVMPVSSPGAVRGEGRPGVVPVYRPEARPHHSGGQASVPGRSAEPRGRDRAEMPRPAPPGRREDWAPRGDGERGFVAQPPRQREGGGRAPAVAPQHPYQGGGRPPAAAPQHPYQGGGRPPAAAPQHPYQGGGRPPVAAPQRSYQGGVAPGPRHQAPPAPGQAPRYQGGERHGGGMAPAPRAAPAPAPQRSSPPARQEGGRGDHGNRRDHR
ncbi:MAG: hypothetical protein HZB56_20840 [Deltaproteobacteria bacterium]|nr:hypothetical protein [Deltaproteobacteria bacterium]